ncbi:MAG TPA: hypothetical protein VD862_00745 [Candidatus Paceibacterota bacterium]|nr:hypothetical protein [Candidatus Paceibacterota bacterium]
MDILETPGVLPDAQTRKRTAENLKRTAWRLMEQELAPWGDLSGDVDAKDLEALLPGLRLELEHCRAMNQYPACVYEVFSPNMPGPRTPSILEALKFLLMTDHVALIQDRPAPAPRTGHIAELNVYWY